MICCFTRKMLIRLPFARISMFSRTSNRNANWRFFLFFFFGLSSRCLRWFWICSTHSINLKCRLKFSNFGENIFYENFRWFLLFGVANPIFRCKIAPRNLMRLLVAGKTGIEYSAHCYFVHRKSKMQFIQFPCDTIYLQLRYFLVNQFVKRHECTVLCAVHYRIYIFMCLHLLRNWSWNCILKCSALCGTCIPKFICCIRLYCVGKMVRHDYVCSFAACWLL